MLTEKPRGKTILSWFQCFAGQDAIHVYDPLLGDIIMPMSPQALRDVLSTHSMDFEKPEGCNTLLATVGGASLIFTGGAQYAKFRKAIHPLFTLRTVRKIHSVSWSKSYLMTDAIVGRKMGDGFHDPWPVLFRYVLDSVCEGFLSYDFDAMASNWDDARVKTLQRTFTPTRHQEGVIAVSLFAPSWLFLSFPTRNVRSLREVSKRLRSIGSQILDSAKATNKMSDPSPEEVLPFLAAQGNLNDSEIVETILTILVAGIETTSAALAWTLHLLTLPDCVKFQTQLRQQLHRKLSDKAGADLDHKDLESIPLLHGIIEESLRLFPPLPLLCHEASRDTEIVGKFVPKGTTVIYWIWALNRNPEYWGPDAAVIDPYRWISTDELGNQHPNKHGGAPSNYSNMSFLHGLRGCVGKETSKATMRAAIARLILDFEISRDPDGSLELEPKGGAIMRPTKGLKLKFSPIGVRS
jgi:cytochrome P450